MKKNFLFNPNAVLNGHSQPLTLPKLSNPTNSLQQYVQYQRHHQQQPSPTVRQNILFNKINNSHSNGLPSLYTTGSGGGGSTAAAPNGSGQFIENKIIGGSGSRLQSKYF